MYFRIPSYHNISQLHIIKFYHGQCNHSPENASFLAGILIQWLPHLLGCHTDTKKSDDDMHENSGLVVSVLFKS